MAEKVQQITTEEMFGIAKKFALQLKQFPMETESAIVEMIRVSMQHRNLQMQREQQLAEMELKNRHVAMQEKQIELQRMAYQRESADKVSTGIIRFPDPSEGALNAQARCAADDIADAAKHLDQQHTAMGHTGDVALKQEAHELAHELAEAK
jgi:hypothetical protein